MFLFRAFLPQPTPPPPVPGFKKQYLCQPLLDAVLANIRSPVFNHSLYRTFAPAMTAIHGPPITWVKLNLLFIYGNAGLEPQSGFTGQDQWVLFFYINGHFMDTCFEDSFAHQLYEEPHGMVFLESWRSSQRCWVLLCLSFDVQFVSMELRSCDLNFGWYVLWRHLMGAAERNYRQAESRLFYACARTSLGDRSSPSVRGSTRTTIVRPSQTSFRVRWHASIPNSWWTSTPHSAATMAPCTLSANWVSPDQIVVLKRKE